DAPRHDVGAGIGHVVAAVAEEMPDAVDHAGRPERDPGDLHQPDEQARNNAESKRIEPEQEEYTDIRMVRIKRALDPVIRSALAVALERLRVERFFHVKEYAAPKHAINAVHLRAMRIIVGLALGVVLAMDCR